MPYHRHKTYAAALGATGVYAMTTVNLNRENEISIDLRTIAGTV
jgi:hypothetical protein